MRRRHFFGVIAAAVAGLSVAAIARPARAAYAGPMVDGGEHYHWFADTERMFVAPGDYPGAPGAVFFAPFEGRQSAFQVMVRDRDMILCRRLGHAWGSA